MNPLDPETFLETVRIGLAGKVKHQDEFDIEFLAERSRESGRSAQDAIKDALETEAEIEDKLQDPRLRALVQNQKEDVGDVELEDENDHRYTASGRSEYLVLTDEEANDAAQEQIEESLWAFNASFLCDFLGFGHRTIEGIEKIQELCEGANEVIRAMIGDRLDAFVEEAIGADGRGHFIAGYDNDEGEETIEGVTYYIYRVG